MSRVVTVVSPVSPQARAYQCAVRVNMTPIGTTVLTGIIGLQHVAGQPDAYLSRISMSLFGNLTNVPQYMVLAYRSVGVSGFAFNRAADIPRKNSDDSQATLLFYAGAVMGTDAAQPLLSLGCVIDAPGQACAGWQGLWKASSLSDRIRLTGSEGLKLVIFAIGSLLTSSQAGTFVTLEWQEVS